MDYLNEKLENDFEKYIEKFEKEFELKTKDNLDKKLLVLLYREYIEPNSIPSKEYYFILNKISEVQKQLADILTEKQKKVMQKYIFLQERLLDECNLQTFIYGYCLGNEMKEETKNYISFSDNKNIVSL